ncbi:MAG: translation initiation factor IF-2 [Myxococcales bacterium]|nr:translation initiation factor IF-2 [Myxococcales bacterium]USN50781.1 MAG: translation initiation factor IF-2 [Myxococcales bacterium]
MGKLRVHELAKKLNMSNQEVIAKLIANGVEVRTHSSSVDEQKAYKALGLSPSGDAVAVTSRPRTVLRRRRDQAEENLPEELNASPASSPVDELKTAAEEKKNLAVVENSEESEPVEKQIELQPTTSASEKEVVSKPTLDKEEKVAPAQKEARFDAGFRPEVVKTDKPSNATSATKETPPSNVVRVIDADAIKARLASEGRSFQRRGYSGGAHARSGGSPRSGAAGAGRNFGGATEREPYVPQAVSPQPPAGPDASQKPGGRPSKKKKGSTNYSREMRDTSSGGRELWLAPGRKKKSSALKTQGKATTLTQAAAHKRVIEMTDAITVHDLAHAMAIKAGQVVSKLLSMGMMVTINEAIDFDTASIVASEFGFEIKNVAFEEANLIKESEDSPENLLPRAPIVTVMGHVDHGKTSVLDALRQTSVVKGEAGGITQHIGAYSVETEHGAVTFLDTPGHEAFTSMRARGAEVTDIVVLVVAADDGVMPQTREAIDHAKAAKVPVVVAINKMDLPDAKPERVMQQLSELGLQPEEWGGDTQFFKVSALKKTGLDDLIAGLAALAEVLELKANPNKPASGCVVEAKLDKGRGPVATILTQSGTLKQGDYVVAGECMGRVRAMYDSNGMLLKEAGPSIPVQVLGLSSVPTAGDQVNAVLDDKTAKTIANHRAQKNREKELLKTKNFSLENFLAQAPGEEAKTLRLIVKADVYGSAEALTASLENLSTKEVKVEIVHSGVGTITESNVNLAMASQAIIIGFNIKADGKAQALAAQEKIDVRYYSVIYEAIDDVRKAMAGLLAPVVEERYLGKAEVRMIISVSKHGKIAGSYVLDGKIVRSAKIRLKRKNDELFVGSIAGLKRFKDDVKEVGSGYECGIVLDGFSDFQEGDILECFELKEVEAKLSESISASEGKNKDVENSHSA